MSTSSEEQNPLGLPTGGTVDPAPRPSRRAFSPEYKLAIVDEYENAPNGEKGAILRREGLCSSHVIEWARACDAGVLAAAAADKPTSAGQRVRKTAEQVELEKLRRQNEKLQKDLKKTRMVLDIMGKGRLGLGSARDGPLSEVGWFSVRCVFRIGSDPRDQSYEERLTLWRAESFDQAIVLAEAEALGYAADQTDTIFAGLAQAYRMFDAPENGAEIFSLIRVSELNPQAYLTAYFDTGQERQGDVCAISDEGCHPE